VELLLTDNGPAIWGGCVTRRIPAEHLSRFTGRKFLSAGKGGYGAVFGIRVQIFVKTTRVAVQGLSEARIYSGYKVNEEYWRSIAIISLHFNRLPDRISEDEITEYLTSLAVDSRSPSRSAFKHMVYGLRYYFRHVGKTDLAINLPSLKKKSTLPVILNRSEIKALFRAPKLLKHRIILALIYSAGLRRQEVTNLRIRDIDFERKTIHLHRSKYFKDRIVPLSDYISPRG